MSKTTEVIRQIDEMEQKLITTQEEIGHPSDPAEKAMKLVLPALQDQLKIMRNIVNLME